MLLKRTQPKRLRCLEELEVRVYLSVSPMAEPSFDDVAYFGGSRDWYVNAINSPEVWEQGFSGDGVIVAVLDSGVDFAHRDLVDNIWSNASEIPDNGIDDDDNGYVDDVRGWDFYDRDNEPFEDTDDHGTHVAGIIAAKNNGFGSTGVAPDATIMPIQVLGGEDGTGGTRDIATAIRYAVDNGADIINLSLGGGGSNRTVRRAIDYAGDHDVLIVAAAGNEEANSPGYPAQYSSRYSNVISVGSFSRSDEIASFSNAVGRSGAVQVDAPGVGIYSTSVNGRYATYSGTSMSTPIVSGLAALILSADPSLGADELRDLIVEGATLEIDGSDSLGGIDASKSVALAHFALHPAVVMPTVAIIPGDVDQNGTADFTDFLILAIHFGMNDVARTEGDLTGDALVTFADFLQLAENYSVGSPTGEELDQSSDEESAGSLSIKEQV